MRKFAFCAKFLSFPVFARSQSRRCYGNIAVLVLVKCQYGGQVTLKV